MIIIILENNKIPIKVVHPVPMLENNSLEKKLNFACDSKSKKAIWYEI